MTFKPQVASWLAHSLLLGYFALICMAFIFRVHPPGLWAVALFALVGVFPLWALINTRYTLTSEELTMVSGPRRETRSTAEIEAIASVKGRVDGMSLSTSGLLLTFSDGKTLFISPLEPARFVQELRRVAPQVQVID
jgi:hypothetical protein